MKVKKNLQEIIAYLTSDKKDPLKAVIVDAIKKGDAKITNNGKIRLYP